MGNEARAEITAVCDYYIALGRNRARHELAIMILDGLRGRAEFTV